MLLDNTTNWPAGGHFLGEFSDALAAAFLGNLGNIGDEPGRICVVRKLFMCLLFWAEFVLVV